MPIATLKHPRLSRNCPTYLSEFIASLKLCTYRGAGYELEIPCVYRLYGPKVYIDKMKELLKDLKDMGLV